MQTVYSTSLRCYYLPMLAKKQAVLDGGFSEREHQMLFEFADAPEQVGGNGMVQSVGEGTMMQVYIRDGSVIGAILSVGQDSANCLSALYLRTGMDEPWSALAGYKGPKGESLYRITSTEAALGEVWKHKILAFTDSLTYGHVNEDDLYPEQSAWRRSRAARFIHEKLDPWLQTSTMLT